MSPNPPRRRAPRTDEHGRAFAGSQRHLQSWVQDRGKELAEGMCAAFGFSTHGVQVEWLSPLKVDDYREYRDGAFLRAIGREDAATALRAFWPRGGPVWDGLARVSQGPTTRPALILIEAKSYPGEVHGRGCLAKMGSETRGQIERALDKTAKWLGVKPTAAWMGHLYQSANRLAHIYFLREVMGIDARLLNVCFVDDPRRRTPLEEWRHADAAFRRDLGIPGSLPWLKSIAVVAEPKDEQRSTAGASLGELAGGRSIVDTRYAPAKSWTWPATTSSSAAARQSSYAPRYIAPEACIGESLLEAFETSGQVPDSFHRLLRSLGDGPLGQAQFIHPIRDEDFIPDRLQGCGLAESRLDALYRGAAPTEEELRLWRDRQRQHVLTGDGDGWNPALLYRVVADDGVELFAVALLTDGGVFDDVFGPYRSAKAALADFQRHGEVQEIEWLDEGS